MHRQRQQRITALGPPAIGSFRYEEQLLFIDLLRQGKNAETEFFSGKTENLSPAGTGVKE
jgi:hypothetical protein